LLFIFHRGGGNYEKVVVDENYLNLVKELFKTKINIKSVFLGNSLHPKLKLLVKEKGVYRRGFVHTRASNIKISNRSNPKRLFGVIACRNNISHNVLLPNGDVVLCCMDYGMKHVLGNLFSSDYDSLFRSKEFLKVKKGLRYDSLDILCRYCEEFAYNKESAISLFTKQKELFLKELKRERLTKTEKEYFSRVVKEKVWVFTNPKLYRLAQKLLE